MVNKWLIQINKYIFLLKNLNGVYNIQFVVYSAPVIYSRYTRRRYTIYQSIEIYFANLNLILNMFKNAGQLQMSKIIGLYQNDRIFMGPAHSEYITDNVYFLM